MEHEAAVSILQDDGALRKEAGDADAQEICECTRTGCTRMHGCPNENKKYKSVMSTFPNYNKSKKYKFVMSKFPKL